MLGARLEMIAEMVPRHARMIDVGTDHAYLPCELLGREQVSFAVASDIASGPCEAAERTINSAGLADKLQVRRGSGLTTVAPGEVDTAVIAGMGGSTMLAILNEAPKIVAELSAIILQPMNGAALLRAWGIERGWDLTDERLCEEAGRLYVALKLERCREKMQGDNFRNETREKFSLGHEAEVQAAGQMLSPLELEIGPLLLHDKPPLLIRYLWEKRAGLQALTLGMRRSAKAQALPKYIAAEELLRTLEDYIHETYGR